LENINIIFIYYIKIMRWNWITILIAILLISFVVYLYTAKLPVEDYMNQYGYLYGEDAALESFESDMDSDLEEGFENEEEEGFENDLDSDLEEGFENDEEEGFENEYDVEEPFEENLTAVDDYSPTCYGVGERACVNTPGCQWTIDDNYYGSCQPS